jgi:hypothetical protein
VELAKTLDGLEDGRFIEEFRLDEVRVLLVKGDVDGVVVAETETQQVHCLFKVSLGLIRYVIRYL